MTIHCTKTHILLRRHESLSHSRNSKPTLPLLTGVGDFHVDFRENNGRRGIAIVGGRRGLGRQDDGCRLEKTLGGAQLEKRRESVKNDGGVWLA